MNKEITIYELLGLIKDNKTPKKIVYQYYDYSWNESKEDYQKSDGDLLFVNINIHYHLNDKVEITEDGFEDIEIINLKDDRIVIKYNSDEELHYMTTNKKDRDIYITKINQLIRNQQKLIDVVNELRNGVKE